MGSFDFGGGATKAAKEHARDVTAAALGAMAIRIPYWYSDESALSPNELAEQHVTLAARMVGPGAAR